MGNDCCGRRKVRESAFIEIERNHLRSLYNELTGPKRAKGKAKFNKNTLKCLFEENPELAVGIYDFMNKVSVSGHVDYETFETSLEVLTKDTSTFQLKEFRSKEKVDMLALIMIGDFSLSRDDLRMINISYIHALDFMKNLLGIFHHDLQVAKPVDEYAARIVVDAAFKEDQGRVDWWDFLQYIKENLIYVNRCLKSYFNIKFLNKQINLKIPELTKASFLLNQDLLGLLYLSNIHMQSISQLQFVYSSRYNGLSFERIAQALEGYEAPTYLLFKVSPIQETRDSYQEPASFVIGGFSRLPWKNTGKYRGDSDCYIFSLAPRFRNFFAMTKASASTNYIYLTTDKESNPGLGFGGTGHNDFRIWIDGNDLNKSYVRSEDNTYLAGSLIEPQFGYMKIIEVEIWGFGADFYSLQGASGIQQYSNPASGNWVTYNQSKIAELMEESSDFAKSLSFFEQRMAQIAKERESYKSRDSATAYRNESTHTEEDERRPQETVKKSYPPAPREHYDIDWGRRLVEEREKKAFSGFDIEPLVQKRNTYAMGSSRAGEDSGILNQPKGRSTYTTSYEYYNPFGGEQNVKITRTIGPSGDLHTSSSFQ